MAENKVLVKEIQIDKGVFPIKSKSGKMSASESYKEQLSSNGLPLNAPKEFKEAIIDLYYVAKESELVKYSKVHGEINKEKEDFLSSISSPTEDDKRKALIESSKKILKNYAINDKTCIVYSPQITKKLEEQDSHCKITVTYNSDEKTLYVKTELLPREKKNIPQEIVIGGINDIDLIPFNRIDNESDKSINQESDNVNTQTHTHSKPELSKADLEELKKKYHFHKPKVESLSSIVKRTVEEHDEDVHIEKTEMKSEVETEKDHIRDIISNSLKYGHWKDHSFIIDHKQAGYLVPVERIDMVGGVVRIQSSSITNTEYWTKFTPIHQCPRFEGALYIPDEYAPFCQQAKCNTACGADEGFVELSAARFRLLEESEIIKNSYQRLQQFLDRCYNLIDEFKNLFGVDIKLDISTQKPFFYSEIYMPFDENVIQNYIEAYKTLYPEITDIRGKIDIERFALNEDYDPVSEAGLVEEARTYNLQEMVRLSAKDMLSDVVKEKSGEVDGNFYLIDHGKFRYLLKPNSIEAYRDELYMGSVGFKRGINEINNFVTTTLGGGRW